MADILGADDYLNQEDASDYTFEEQTPSGAKGAGARNTAAFLSLHSDNPVETYQQFSDELTQGLNGSVIAAEQSIEMEELQANTQVMANILQDPMITDEQKLSAAAFLRDQQKTDLRKVSVERMMMRPNGEETEAREEQRSYLAQYLDSENEAKKLEQALLNHAAVNMSFEGATGLSQVAMSFLPFVSEWASDDILERFERDGLVDGEDLSNFFIFAGSNRATIRDAYRQMAPDQKIKVLHGMFAAIEDESGFGWLGTNQAIQLDNIRTMIEDDYYEDIDEVLDNVFGAIDAASLGFTKVVRTGVKSLLGISKQVKKDVSVKDMLSRSRRNAVKGSGQPMSVGKATAVANPDSHRMQHAAIVADETGQVAEATRGTSREDAIADDLLPDVRGSDNITGSTVAEIDRVEREVTAQLEKSGHLELSEDELLSAVETFGRRFTQNQSMTFRPASSHIGINPDTSKYSINAVFGESADAGFTTFDDAVREAVNQANRFGLGADSVKIQAKNQLGEFVDLDADTALEAARGAGNEFLVRFDFDYAVSPLDVSRWESAGVSQGLFGFLAPDKFTPLWQGKLTRWLKDPASTFDSRLAAAGSVAEDRASVIQKVLLSDAEMIDSKLGKLEGGEQQKVVEYWHHANREGVRFDPVDLKAEGFTDEAIEVMRDFRNYWDRDWRLNNEVRRKQLRSEGVVAAVDGDVGTKLYGKESVEFIQKLDKGRVRYYDMIDDEYKYATNEDLPDTFMNDSHTMLKLVSPLTEDGVRVEWVRASRNHHVRTINDKDMIIPYRQGYFKTNYTGSYFIDRVKRDMAGNELERVAVKTGDIPSKVESEARRLNRDNLEDDIEYEYRRDIKDPNDIRRKIEEVSISVDGFRQHHRGERLGDADNIIGDAEIEDPIATLTRAAGATSRKMAYNDWIATSRARFVEQYSRVIKTQHKGYNYPMTLDEITDYNQPNLSGLASEAKTTWEYINHMEMVRMNFGAAVWKYGLKSLQERLGQYSHTSSFARGAEALANEMSTWKPIEVTKRLAFEAAVVLNPLRQLTLGVADVLTKAPIYHKHMITAVRDTPALIMLNMARGSKGEARAQWLRAATTTSGKSQKELEELLDAFHASGLVAAIDKQAMMAAGLHTEIERASKSWSKPLAKAGAAYNKVSRATAYKGFEYNEYLTQGLLYAAAFNKAKAANKGMKLTNRQLDQITAEVRNLNYGQNRAGELAYNTSIVSALFQFMQIPHKAVLMALPAKLGGNRLVSGKAKATLIGSSLALYGTPEDFLGVPILDEITKDIEDEQLRNTVRHGLAWTAFFNSFDASISTKEFNPFDPEAITEKFISLFSGVPFSESPAMQFAWPRVADAIKMTTGVWGKGFDDYDTEEKFAAIASKWAEISSGYSNFSKSRYAMKHGMFVSGNGWIGDAHVTPSEAWLKMTGVRTLDELETFDFAKKEGKVRKTLKEDVQKWYNDMKKFSHTFGEDLQSDVFIMRAMGEFWRAHEGTPEAAYLQEELHRLIRQDGKKGEVGHFLNVMRSIDYRDPDELKGLFNTSGLSEENIKKGHQVVDDFNNRELYGE